MNKISTTLFSGLVLSSALTMVGCGSSGDDAPTVSPPPNAIVFDDSNAYSSVNEALGYSGTVLFSPKTASATSTSSTNALVKQAIQQLRNQRKTSGVDIVSATAFEESFSCVDLYLENPAPLGSANSVSVKGNYNDTSTSGVTTFYTCEIEPGLSVTGKISFSYSDNGDAYSDRASGAITLSGNVAAEITRMVFSETGNYATDDYITKVLQYVYDPSAGSGFSIKVTSSIVGNYLDCGPTAGVILLEGGSGTKVRVTYNSNMSITVELDDNLGGGFVPVTGSPFYPCV